MGPPFTELGASHPMKVVGQEVEGTYPSWGSTSMTWCYAESFQRSLRDVGA